MDVIVNKSRIHGKGVFASRDFRKGELVIRYDLRNLLTKDEVKKLPISEKAFVSKYKDDKFILHHAPARFVNHSCDPNVVSTDLGDVAKRDIMAGEEITVDYSHEVVGINVPCRCGSRNCRKIIRV